MRIPRLPCPPAVLTLLAALGCSEPEPADVVALPPTAAVTVVGADSDREIVFDLANPNGFPVAVDALFVGVDVGEQSQALCVPLSSGGCAGEAPDWPDGASLVAPPDPPDALTLPPRETTECYPAIEGCVVDGDEWCCVNGAGCKPLRDCIGRVVPDGSRCLVCPVHVEVRLPLALDEAPDAVRGAARFSSADLGASLIVAE